MLVKTIAIRTDHTKAELTTYFQDSSPELGADRKRSVVLICPGGAYGFVSNREAEPELPLNSISFRTVDMA